MRTLVLSIHDVEQFGCPSCGYKRAYIMINWPGELQHCVCIDCQCDYIALAEGVTSSRCIVRTSEDPNPDSHLQPHPRQGIPAHDHDLCPSAGGEYLYALGVEQFEAIQTCFVCGQGKTLGKRFVGMTPNTEIRGRILSWFPHSYPDRKDPQRINIEACGRHLENIHLLFRLVRAHGIVNEALLQEAKQ